MCQRVTSLPMPKQYHELTFTDNFLFCKIMEKNHELCRQILEIILGIKIKKLVSVNSERTLGMTPEGKSVRLDVYVEDDAETVYNIEMQTSEKKNLPKRMRYYQGIIDLNLIEKGADYSELNKSFVIFICTFDFFRRNLPVYTFTNKCTEMPDLEFGDDTTKVLINPYAACEGMPDDMRVFLRYLRGEKTSGSELVETIDREVVSARDCEEWRVEYMTLMMEYREKYKEGEAAGFAHGMEEGLEKGLEKGIAQGAEQTLERINELNRRLHEDGRMQDLLMSFENPTYQKSLLEEYGI